MTTCKRRVQCAKCPWRKDVDPRDIPNGYSQKKHADLRDTIAEPGALPGSIGALKVMACHETPVGGELACVGWLANQLGPGNNIALRLSARRRPDLTNYELIGEQHERFEDTLPKGRKRGKKLPRATTAMRVVIHCHKCGTEEKQTVAAGQKVVPSCECTKSPIPNTHERRAIAALKQLAKNWPKTLWLYSSSGSLHVMRRGADGEHVMLAHGGVDPTYSLACVDIPNDGGDW